MAIVFMGTPAFAVPSLQRLAAEGYGIAAVYTQPDRPAGRGRHPRPSPVKVAAQELGLPVREPATLSEPEALSALRSLAPEAIVVVAYGQILRQDVLDVPPRGVLNVHPSLLPRHRGAAPIPAAILAGDGETGVTVMLMDAGMDTGPIVAQRAMPVEPADTAGSLGAKLSAVAADLLAETLPRWLRGEIEPQPQDDSRATKAPLLRKEQGAIDWGLPAAEIWRRVRAYNPWPGAYSTLDGEIVHIWEAWPLEEDSGQRPGTLVPLTDQQRAQLPPGADREAFAVQTGRGLLVVLLVQRAGRRALPPGDFLRGARDALGKRLVSPK
ncbi:MAG TPA: methionyl-tRNA formyltransferase [Dehalococcoidia bacterium]|nr:methionyl-tRNA formyltransferase [Dehalococcoidia bacterium]